MPSPLRVAQVSTAGAVLTLFALYVALVRLVREPGVGSIAKQAKGLFKLDSGLNLNGCKNVYLDMGSNVEIQVRKVFEPHLYPDSPFLEHFNANFGDNVEARRSSVCVVGFEPNEAHTQRIKALEDAYNKCGWRTHFFTETAVSDHNGVATLYTDNNKESNFWSSSIVRENKRVKGTLGQVKLLRLSDVINKFVATRKTLSGEERGKGLMKIDIEGSEVEVVPDLVSSGAIKHIDKAYIEWDDNESNSAERKRATAKAKEYLLANRATFVSLDDESYGNSDFPLPNCDNGKGTN